MRTYGRQFDAFGNVVRQPDGTNWAVVQTDANGNNDAVYLTTLAQVLKGNLGESPFYSNYGIPAQPTIMTQVFPDFYVAQTQQQFAPFFASITIQRNQSAPSPVYNVSVTSHTGAIISLEVPT
jgi:hypothetical protein